ncbi:MAG: SRPBCC domain-containing protein [Anaerolineales bacterium]|jgi:uncharacterized protein YndB with AHSA1/START domain
MSDTLTTNVTVTIRAPASRVWEALTNPILIKQYLFGTDVTSDWKVGSPIIYRGLWQGKPYEDKGRVLRNEPGRLLVSTFWSSLSGLPDLPENYKTLRHELFPGGNTTRLTLTQDNNSTQEEANHSAQNWKTVLEGMKMLLEA